MRFCRLLIMPAMEKPRSISADDAWHALTSKAISRMARKTLSVNGLSKSYSLLSQNERKDLLSVMQPGARSVARSFLNFFTSSDDGFILFRTVSTAAFTFS